MAVSAETGDVTVPPDPTLEALIVGGHFAIAADRYEEQSGDSELAALMRIDGLEWELADGLPGLKLTSTNVDFDRWFCWEVCCGRFDFGSVSPTSGHGHTHDAEPRPCPETPIGAILSEAGLPNSLIDHFYRLYCEAVWRECYL